jgi:hypothetical protein
MAITMRVKVIGLGTDADPFTGAQYTAVTLAIDSPVPPVPPNLQNMYPPVPRPIVHKHIMHIFVPTQQWVGQYKMWEEFSLTIEDNGAMRMEPAATSSA